MSNTYLADGTKVAMHREDTALGLAWLGDMVFTMREDAVEPESPVGEGLRSVAPEGQGDEEEVSIYSFESTPYSVGRIEADGTLRKFVTDHLGSVRAVVTDNAVVERSDYYPFGGRHDNPAHPRLSTNRYGFSGKERQDLFSSISPYLDFGARFYDPLTARWLSPDPMADKYTNFTQYNYCGGDPVNFVDPFGMDIVIEGSDEFKNRYESVREWLRQNDCDQLLVAIEKDHSVRVTIIESNYSSKIDGRYSKKDNHLTKATLRWNPNNYLLNQDESIMISPVVILMHEMKHISEMIQDVGDFNKRNKEKNDNILNDAEQSAVLFESFIAGKLREIPEGTITRSSHRTVLSSRIPDGLSAKNQSAFTSRYNDKYKLPKLRHQALLNAILKDEKYLR